MVLITHTDYHSVIGIDDTDIIIGRFWTEATMSIQIAGLYCIAGCVSTRIGYGSPYLTRDYHWNTVAESDVQIGGDFSNGMTENAIQRGIWNSRVTDPIVLNSYIGSSRLSYYS